MTRTPGQAAYEAYYAGDDRSSRWAKLSPEHQQVWANAAKAALLARAGPDAAERVAENVALVQRTIAKYEQQKAEWPDGPQVGQRVFKDVGYYFEGRIAAVFAKKDGAVRLVVENDDGLLMIMRLSQVRPA